MALDAAFRVELYPERDAMRVVPIGELDLAGACALAMQLHELRDAGFARIVLDVRALDLIDPTVIALMIADARFAPGNGCELSLLPGAAAIKRARDVCGLLERLRGRPDEREDP
ncbi:MAG: STAS domain-containing protein [Solirubrobacteraceae bacterium]